ncbi:hypothetical protein HID58_037151, partial [Brassica napus]
RGGGLNSPEIDEGLSLREGMEEENEFYLRYYVGHKGKFGHEFLEFEFRPDGKLRYANNSNYKNDTMIRKEVFLTPAVLKECKRIVSESEIMKEDDFKWPEPDRVGRQELEIVMGNEHISFATSKIGSLVDVQSSDDPEGLRIFYYLVQVSSLFPFSILSLILTMCFSRLEMSCFFAHLSALQDQAYLEKEISRVAWSMWLKFVFFVGIVMDNVAYAYLPASYMTCLKSVNVGGKPCVAYSALGALLLLLDSKTDRAEQDIATAVTTKSIYTYVYCAKLV